MKFELIILIKLLLVLGVGLLFYFTARRGMGSLLRREMISPQSAMVLGGAIKWTLIIAITLICLSTAGISVASLWASLSAVLLVVAIGFVAVWSILSNASCALFLVFFAPFRIGDEIEILEPATIDPSKPGIRGKVVDISFIHTTIAERDNKGGEVMVHVPNNQLFQKAIRCRRGRNTTSLKDALFDSGPVHETEAGAVQGSREDV